jgi:Sec23/Sec24 zinc finger/Sec23/Sec24 trunk domain
MSSWFGFSSSSPSSRSDERESKSNDDGATAATDDDDDDDETASIRTTTAPRRRRPSAFRRRADEGATFTSSKCPPGPGLQNSCELPFGFVWTPMAAYNDGDGGDGDGEENIGSSNTSAYGTKNRRRKMAVVRCTGEESLPPVLCLGCLAYLNPFAEMNYSTGVWTCPLCGRENVAPKDELHREGSKLMPALRSSVVEYRQRMPSQGDLSKNNGRAPAEDGGHKRTSDDDDDDGEADYCTYVLVVDENLSPADGQAIAPAMENLLKGQFEAARGGGGRNGTAESFPTARMGLVVFGKAVAVYKLGLPPGLASADMYCPPGDADGDEGSLANGDMEKQPYLAEFHPGDSLTTLRTCLSSVFGMTVPHSSSNSSGTMPGMSRMEMLVKRKDARVRRELQHLNGTSHVGPAESPWVKRGEDAKAGHPKRCTGEAVQCALDLAGTQMSQMKPSRTSRIIVFTNGCPNIGDGSVVTGRSLMAVRNRNAKLNQKAQKTGKQPAHDVVDGAMLQKAVEYFDLTANFAVSSGVGFDVFCCGVHELALPAYQALVEPSGGYVIPLLSFDEKFQLQHNLNFLLEHTYMSRSRYIPEDMDDNGGAECILDIRSEIFVSPTQLCGSGEVLTNHRMVENERPAFAAGAALAADHGIKTNNLPSTEAIEVSLTRIQVGRVDPLSTFAIMLEIDDNIRSEDDYAFFQLVSRYISRNGREEITRVCSFKLPVAKDVSDFVAGLDDEAVSVVLGKAAVYRVLHGRQETSSPRDVSAAGDTDAQEKLAYDTQVDLDATVQRISGAFRLLGLEEKMRR